MSQGVRSDMGAQYAAGTAANGRELVEKHLDQAQELTVWNGAPDEFFTQFMVIIAAWYSTKTLRPNGANDVSKAKPHCSRATSIFS